MITRKKNPPRSPNHSKSQIKSKFKHHKDHKDHKFLPSFFLSLACVRAYVRASKTDIILTLTHRTYGAATRLSLKRSGHVIRRIRGVGRSSSRGSRGSFELHFGVLMHESLIGCASVFGVGHVELLGEVVFGLGRVDEVVGLVVC